MNNVNSFVQFVNELNTCMQSNYLAIQDIFNLEYDYPELDPIRDEICKCIICGLSQSAITLTNHLLEKSMKFCLEIKYSKENKKEEAKLEDVFVDAINKYDNLNLDDTINRACTQGLITKKQKSELKNFKDDFRNPFSHANTDVFKDLSIKGKTVTTEDLTGGLEQFLEKCFEKDSDKKILLKNLLPVQGVAQVRIAQENCLPYFKSVDGIIRNMLINLEQ